MVYVILADGFEEIEAIEPIDILRRCGVEVATASIADTLEVCGAHGIKMQADMMAEDVDLKEGDVLMLPGGPGHELLDASNIVHGLINEAQIRHCITAAICAAPSVIGKKSMLSGKRATCYPGYEKYLYGADVTGNKVEIDGSFITGKGPGAAADFGFALAALLKGQETADAVRKAMQF